MKILILETGAEATVQDEYACRLIEQGKAVVVKAGAERRGQMDAVKAGRNVGDESNRSATGASAQHSGFAVTGGTVPLFRAPEAADEDDAGKADAEAETPAANTGKGKKTGGKR